MAAVATLLVLGLLCGNVAISFMLLQAGEITPEETQDRSGSTGRWCVWGLIVLVVVWIVAWLVSRPRVSHADALEHRRRSDSGDAGQHD